MMKKFFVRISFDNGLEFDGFMRSEFMNRYGNRRYKLFLSCPDGVYVLYLKVDKKEELVLKTDFSFRSCLSSSDKEMLVNTANKFWWRTGKTL